MNEQINKLIEQATQVVASAGKELSIPLASTRDPLAIEKLRKQAADTQVLLMKLLPWKNKIVELKDATESQAQIENGRLYREKKISATERDGNIQKAGLELERMAQQLTDFCDLASKRLSLSQTLIKSADYQDFNTISSLVNVKN